MTDKLTLYNEALGHLEERKLASLTERREPRFVLDDYFDGVVAYCLERKFWNFSYRSAEIDVANVTPLFGYLYATAIPDDWIRTRLLSASPTFNPPLLQFSEQAGFWYTNVTPIYVQYNSNDPLFGMDLGKWPASFADYVGLRLARRACKRVTGTAKLLGGPDGLIAEETKAYKIANANCAMNEAVGFAPMSGWVRARRGFGVAPGPNGDEPSGGSLIP